LGLDHVIDEAMLADWAGSAVLEHIMMLQDNTFQGFTFGLKETIVIARMLVFMVDSSPKNS
jgi:hypothetical protein